MPPPTTTARRTSLARATGRAGVLFPLIVLAAAAVLVALDLNGSSVAILGLHSRTDPNLLAGTPRIIRSDEAALSTATLVGNVRRGLPTTPWIGLTPTFLPATAVGAPAAHWTEAFKPQDWGLLVLGLGRGFAWHWWSQLVVSVLGVFALLYTLTRRGWTSAALAVVASVSPYVAWWSLTPGLILGFASGAAALVVRALRAGSTRAAVAWGLGAGYLAVASFLLLYPPWQVTIAWVLLGLVVGVVLDSRVRLRRLALVVASVLVVLGTSVTVWFVESRPTIVATANTIYPGHRLAGAQQANLAWLFDQASSPFVAAAPARALRGPTLLANGKVIASNQSELASAWLPLPVIVVAVVAVLLVLLARRRAAAVPGSGAVDLAASAGDDEPATGEGPADPPLLWTTVGVCAAGVLLLAWGLLPLPGFVGQVTLLDRVPGQRISLALGLVAVLLLAIASSTLRELRPSLLWWLVGGVTVVATAWLMLWAALSLPWTASDRPSHREVLLLAAVLAAAFALIAAGRWLGVVLPVLVLVSVASWAVVNPWYRGLGPLVNDPVVRAMEPLATGPHPARVAVFGSSTLDALVQGSGVVTLSGLTLFPDANVWKSLAPDQESVWNNYAKYAWVADASVDPAYISTVSGTQHELHINPCAPQTLALKIDYVVSSQDLSSFTCLRPAGTIDRGGAPVYRYRVAAS